MIKALGDFFDPKKFSKLFGGVVDIFTEFFQTIDKGPHALSTLLDKLKEHFMDFFDSNLSLGHDFLGGLKKFGSALVNIFAGFTDIVMDTLTEMFIGIANFIKDPSGVPDIDAMSPVRRFLKPIEDAFRENWPAISEAFMGMLEAAWEALKPKLVEFAKKNWKWMFGLLFGPA